MYKKEILLPGLSLIIFLIGVSYGIIIHRNEIFPYKLTQTIYHQLPFSLDKGPRGIWSIGIYEGSSIFDLSEPANFNNPVLTAKDVTDLNAHFVADPFMIKRDDVFYMFFEIMDKESGLGKIGYAESNDGYDWNYQKVVIDEDFHLSYPYVFEYDDIFYMVPESSRDLSVRLYKATNFPIEWQHIGNLLEGYQLVDNTFIYDSLWWMFTSTGPDYNTLHLYYSKNLFDVWVAHPMNPIIYKNPQHARPGGRVIMVNEKIYRLAQNCYPKYGLQVFAFEITKLSSIHYEEQLASQHPIVTGSGEGWNAVGMHHVDPIRIGDRWLVAVDGYYYRNAFFMN